MANFFGGLGALFGIPISYGAVSMYTSPGAHPLLPFTTKWGGGGIGGKWWWRGGEGGSVPQSTEAKTMFRAPRPSWLSLIVHHRCGLGGPEGGGGSGPARHVAPPFWVRDIAMQSEGLRAQTCNAGP